MRYGRVVRIGGSGESVSLAAPKTLEDLAVELFARGLSTCDIEAAFTDADGRRLVSRAAVSEITERAGCPREPVIAAWGVGRNGQKGRDDTCVLPGHMRARGLGDPILVASDGAPGIIRRLRNASRARPDSAAWRTGCVIST